MFFKVYPQIIADARRVLKKRMIEFSKFRLTCIPVAKSRGRRATAKLPESSSLLIKPEKNYPIEISNIDKKIIKSHLKMFLEQKSGGFHLERISHNIKEGRAIVMFNDIQGLDEFCTFLYSVFFFLIKQNIKKNEKILQFQSI